MTENWSTMGRIFNFSAGPATLPLPVMEDIQKNFLDYQGSGMSVIEMSHRGQIFKDIYAESVANLRKIANIPDRFDILYMQGGASTQFALIPMNLSGKGRKAGYVNTGSWSKKAIAQGKLAGVDLVDCGNSDDKNFNYIPTVNAPAGMDYLHITSNNTIFGTEFAALPNPGDSKLIIDMSSNFLSGPIDWTNIGMVYAGAQKNAGPSGVTVIVIDKEYYERESDSTPDMFRYSTYAKNDSMYNTPPTFQIYVFGLVLKWIESQGGLAGVAAGNKEKASYIYDVIDANPDAFIGHAEKDSRSMMNVTFNLKDKDKEADFLAGAKALNLDGLKGHRSVGGFRASIYNAMSKDGCKALADYMTKFAKG